MSRLGALVILFAAMLSQWRAEARPLPSLRPQLPQDSREAFLKLVRTRTVLILRDFRKVCSGNKTLLAFDQDQEIFDMLNDVKKRPDITVLRGLVHALSNCTEGKSRDSLVEFLGVDILTTSPLLLVRALYREKAGDDLTSSLARAEPDEIAGVDCSAPECQQKRKDAFTKKKSALEKIRVRKDEEPVRARLMAALSAATAS
ncbi:MAG TPA: hypothetical protein VFV50_11155 [Bdellovibrionales bacterium]|nr:hypothetical protein [Bdellovibrionales bacterium]